MVTSQQQHCKAVPMTEAILRGHTWQQQLQPQQPNVLLLVAVPT